MVSSQGGTRLRYILQRVNHAIFRDVPAVMDNIQRVTRHLRAACRQDGATDRSRRVLTIVPTRAGQPCWRDENGNFWRLYVFIEAATTYDTIESPTQAYAAARAFGQFQRQLADLDGPRLHETIPDFHHTRSRFAALLEAARQDPGGRLALARPELDFALAREPLVDTLLDLAAAGDIPERITHNDTKLNNVMLDDTTGEGICVIDLDTVMPGLALYDFGDMVRSATRPTAEDERDLAKVEANLEMFAALIQGYAETAGPMLVEAERANLELAGRLITFEIGLRFLTDFLLGDRYFKTHRPQHNLDRCRVQFKMVQSFERQQQAIHQTIRACLTTPSRHPTAAPPSH